MDLNSDFGKRVLVHTEDAEWVASPMPGVHRRMLDRIGGELARATSVVRYAPGSRFSRHVHGGGEEFLVLEGVFQDEHGDYPAGSYVRNPPQSGHTPGSDTGCVILVKLWQFDPEDRAQVRIDSNKITRINDLDREKVTLIPLFRDHREDVRLEVWAPGAFVPLHTEGGAELFVLEGGFVEGPDRLRQGSWLRVPAGGSISATAGDAGAKVWVKTGHLRFVQPAATAPR